MQYPITVPPVTGPFSGINYNHLTETPILDPEAGVQVLQDPMRVEQANQHPLQQVLLFP